jgi:phage portal protein BeeE
MPGWFSRLKEKRIAAQQLRRLSSLYVQPFNFFNSQGRVRAETALALSACWAAIDRISSDLSVCPLEVFKRRSDGGADWACDHYLTYILQNSMDGGVRTPLNHRKLVSAHILGYGDGYCGKEVSGNGKLIALHPIPPHRVEPKILDSSKRVYVIDNGKTALEPEQIVNYYGLSHDGVHGISPVRAYASAIAAGTSADAYGLAFFNNGYTPSGFIEFPGKYSPGAGWVPGAGRVPEGREGCQERGSHGVRPIVRRGKRGSSVGAIPTRQVGRSSR